MAYQTPTTANQMYEILKTIYYDYRLKIDAYEDAGLENLLLERMTFVEKSDEELFSIARELTAPWFDQEYEKAKRELDAKIQALVEKKERESLDVAKKIDALNEEVEKSKKEIEKEAIKRGYINSDVTVSKIVKLEENRLNKIEQIHQESKNTISNLDEEISALNVLAKSIRETFEEYHNNKANAKFIELKSEQEKEAREVFKYNNALDEKEKRSKNANISANASLKLRYLEIRSQSYSKEELVDMGYYSDVIACVRGYYDSISNAVEAYTQFKADNTVLIYLEDYYGSLLSLYKARAGL